ncbi:hypothetical protein, partial [Azospirillum griseum]|uniref:hypothetical protein n=1 Tax=Azospirillum griseum TaxID=2496639 RepID=UPI00363A7472
FLKQKAGLSATDGLHRDVQQGTARGTAVALSVHLCRQSRRVRIDRLAVFGAVLGVPGLFGFAGGLWGRHRLGADNRRGLLRRLNRR